MDEFMQFQHVLNRHRIPYFTHDRRPFNAPILIIDHPERSIRVVFDEQGAYVTLAVEPRPALGLPRGWARLFAL